MTLRRSILVGTIAAATVLAGEGALRAARFQQADGAVTVLTDGLKIERAAATGDTHRYEARLSAGDFVEITASQDQLRLSLAVHDPAGQIILNADLPELETLPERVLFLTSVGGRYEIHVSIKGQPYQGLGHERDPETNPATTVRSAYSLHVVAMRPATSDDFSRARWFGVLERAATHARLQSIKGLEEAIPLYLEAASGWRSLGDLGLEATTLEGLANLTSFFVQFTRDSAVARERLTQLYRQMGNRPLELANWRRLALEYWKVGRLADAKEAAEHALKLALLLGGRVNAAASRRQLGSYEFDLGNFSRARELAEETLAAAVAIPDRALQVFALGDLGLLDTVAGDLDAAIVRNREALALASGQRELTVVVLRLAFNHLARGDLDEAASRFEERLTMARTAVQRDQEALARLGLADIARVRGDRNGARERYADVVAALERGVQKFRCIAMERIARMDLEDGRLADAERGFQGMLKIAAGYVHCEAEAHAGLAEIAARHGDLDVADREARRVVELTEKFREAAVSLESRALGFGALAPAYERAIEISMRRAARGEAEAVARAFALNEQALARGLVDRLLESRLDTSARVPPALATERAAIRDQWRARLAELEIAMRTRPDTKETSALGAETSRLGVRLRDLEARIDAVDARHAGFIRPRPLTVAAAQALLDDDTLLLEYALGHAHSYLFVVSRAEIRAFTLPPRAEIERIARRVHEQLARSPVVAPPDVEQHDGFADQQALTRILLEPAAPLLAGKRLVAVLPGALSLVPLGALPQPGRGATPPPMMAGHEIVQVPSATTLAATRALTKDRARPTRAAAVFADPVFDPRDPRLRRAASSDAPAHVPSAVQRSGKRLGRLPFSRHEAEAIAALTPGRVTTFLGLDATRDRAVNRALFGYRFIHFATHGIVYEDVPSLSSLVLSLVDGAGRPRDGLVMLPDVYDMTLNADLVVLSGCQTALGKPVRGEGPIGLARAFMYAGVPRVVASLWLVDDLATAELMKRFYRGILVDRLTPAAALRAAQGELAANPRWKSPYYWAPFVLQGDWR